MFHFYTPWKHQKICGFLVFSGGIKVENWKWKVENGLSIMYKLVSLVLGGCLGYPGPGPWPSYPALGPPKILN